MQIQDDFSAYYSNLWEGQYDCIDRIVLNGYFSLGQQGGGFRTGWRQLNGADNNLDSEHLQKMAGRFSRRVRGWAEKHNVPLIYCRPGQRKHDLAPPYFPTSAKK